MKLRASLRHCQHLARSADLREGPPYAAVRQPVGLPVGAYVEFRKTGALVILPASRQPFGEFDMVADVEELDRIAVILGEFEKRMRARGHDPAAEFKCLRYRPGRGLSDFQIRENDGVAHRHAGKKLVFDLRAHEMDA